MQYCGECVLSLQEERDKKKVDQLERRKETQRLADEEMAAIKQSPGGAAGTVGNSGKVTRAEIDANQSQMLAAAAAAAGGTESVLVDELPIEENVNRLMVDGLEARSVDEAIKLLR